MNNQSSAAPGTEAKTTISNDAQIPPPKVNFIIAALRKVPHKLVLVGIIAMHTIVLYIVFNIYYKATKLEQELVKHRTEKVEYENIVNFLNKRIVEFNDSITSLIELKSKINTKYETKIERFSDIRLVPNDSVTSYISTKIYNKRR